MSSVKKIPKRNGRVVDFEQDKIANTIFKAFPAVGEQDRGLAKELPKEVIEALEHEHANKMPTVENVQNIGKRISIEKHAKAAKASILYGKKHGEMGKTKSTFSEMERIVSNYLGQSDWRVKENSNVDYSLSGLMLHISGSVIANYTLSKVYPLEVAEAHVSGDLHLHDLGMGITGYCAGWSLSQLLLEGFNGVPGRISSKPPAHLDTALLQMVNFIGTLQNEWAGAQAFNSVDTMLAPFVREDGLNYKQVKQAIQTFIFNLNITSRWGSQTPFTNITLDWTVPEDLVNKNVILKGEVREEVYGDYQEEVGIINRAFLEVMREGDMNGRPFTFPIPTYGLSRDFAWEGENASLLFGMTAKYGLPYFQNFINSDLKPSDVRSMCCRLRLDLRELRRNVTAGLFGSGDSTGSVGVVTINMPRLGYLSKDESSFFERLDHVMELARISLEIKREMVEKNIRNGLLPFTKRYLGTLRNHFSTIGLVGMNEACLNLFGEGIATNMGRSFAIRALKFMRGKIQEFQEQLSLIHI